MTTNVYISTMSVTRSYDCALLVAIACGEILASFSDTRMRVSCFGFCEKYAHFVTSSKACDFSVLCLSQRFGIRLQIAKNRGVSVNVLNLNLVVLTPYHSQSTSSSACLTSCTTCSFLGTGFDALTPVVEDLTLDAVKTIILIIFLRRLAS